jgi:hypothetical protein
MTCGESIIPGRCQNDRARNFYAGTSAKMAGRKTIPASGGTDGFIVGRSVKIQRKPYSFKLTA